MAIPQGYNMEEWALFYAQEKGWAVFPLVARTKDPATEHGFYDATKDPKIIRSWWRKNPQYNIGMATGNASGVVVLDFDEDKDKGKHGTETLKEWERTNGEAIPDTVNSITGRGGTHYLYGLPAGEHQVCRIDLYPGVDVRGDGGYICLPPSVHPNGRRYEWEYGPDESAITPLNDTVRKFLKGGETTNKTFFSVPDQIGEGSRNGTLYKAACSLQAKGWSDKAILEAVRQQNSDACDPPLPDKEVETIVKSALKHEKGQMQAVCNNGKAEVKEPHKLAKATSGDELERMNFPEQEFLVDEILPESSFGLLVAPPKSFKSFLCLDLCASIADGRDFLGFKTRKAETLYYDLESSLRRPYSRLKKIMQGAPFPKGLHIVPVSEKPGTLSDGFLEDMQGQLGLCPGIKLIVVDVFQRIRGKRDKSLNSYENDYKELERLQTFAAAHKVSIILVHHTRKGKSEDAFETISGSNGLFGSADFCWIISKERKSKKATLSVNGREIKPDDFAIEFQDGSCTWSMLGQNEEFQEQMRVHEYNNSFIISTIKGLVKQSGGLWSGTAQDIKTASKYFSFGWGEVVEDVRKIGRYISDNKDLLHGIDGIIVTIPTYGNRNGRKYTFRSIDYKEYETENNIQMNIEDVQKE